VESNREQLGRIEQELVRLNGRLDTLRSEVDERLDTLREHTDRGFADLRVSIDEMRKENARTTRWLVGLTITYGTAIVGMMAKMGGVF
jgi:chromosome segregation ATPase